MTRWDYDTVFYRVFCTALLCVALVFTVILTNVFIDIDGLLYKKNKANTDKLESIEAVTENVITSNFVPKTYMYDYKDYANSYTAERTKRSLESQDFSYHIKDPKMKKEITNRLTALLEDLDREESSKIVRKENKLANYRKNADTTSQNINEDTTKGYKDDVEFLDNEKKSIEDLDNNNEFLEDIERIKKENDKKLKSNHNELKQLAMHNIILQGIIGHMDLGEVYARVHALIHNLETSEFKADKLKEILHPAHEQFFNELVNCKQLKDQITVTTKPEFRRTAQTMENEIRKSTVKPIGRNVMIKTIIDITSLVNDKTNQDNESKENVNGIIKLIYNGKSLKFRRVDENTTTPKPIILKKVNDNTFANLRTDVDNIKETEDKVLSTVTNRNPDIYVSNVYMKKMISDYLKRFSKESERLDNARIFTTKRLKRHVEILYDNEENTKPTAKPPKNNDKNGDDELYVEIETHFDSKGLKGEKKKKMIRDLVAKIQKAIHSEKEIKKKKHKHLHVKKRTQNPLDSENVATFVSKQSSPLNSLAHREIDPISKSMPLHENVPYISDHKGDNWRRAYNGPRFLTATKAINSAEMSELNTNYNKIMDNGIPQRLQLPLNTDGIGETSIFNNMQEQGNANIVVKNIAGSGFSIGFNQYVDEPPDAESMKLFTGIENIIQTYHQKYDEQDANAESTNAIAETTNQENLSNPRYSQNAEQPANREYLPDETDDHLIVRRSIKKIKRDYHSNEYKVIFNKNFLNYNNYQDIYNKGKHSDKNNSEDTKKTPALVIDDSIFNKDLKPAEIFNLADLLERQKRSLNVKKISNINIKSKKKINRYLNTKSMASKKIFKQNKRSKRQINKIRIIAKDLSKHRQQNSEEDIFIMSDEKVFADRAMMKEVEMQPSKKTNEEHFDVIASQKPVEEHFDIITPQKVPEDHYDIISPQKETDNHYDIISPYNFDAPSLETSNTNNIFIKKSRHNSLMSKYPHLFMEEITRSKEDFTINNPYMYGKMKDKYSVHDTTQIAPAVVEIPEPQLIPDSKFKNPDIQEIVDHYLPQDKSNYKVIVKIMPKNNTGINSGFKEIHTSINKSYNKNGLVYTSLVNVSEISKVEKINKTKESHEIANPSVNKLKKEQLRMKSIIQQHKDRIEEQLAHLKREKENLDRIDIRNTEFLKDAPRHYVEPALLISPERTQQIAKEDLSRPLNFENNTTEQPSTSILTTTTEYIEPTTEDIEKIKILNTIEKNEKITNEILTKIDKNTDILQIFLNKLISKIEGPAIETTRKQKEYPKNSDTVNKNANNYEEPKTPEPRTIEMYDQSIPNAFFSLKNVYTNSSGIPFVYAFQRPYRIPNNDGKDVPIANVVYQGHIHAETVNKKSEHARIWQEKPKKGKQWKLDNAEPAPKDVMLEAKNSTKFFIDDLENDYKVLPVEGKTVYSVNVNSTKV